MAKTRKMNNKKTRLIFLGIFILLFSLSFSSAIIVDSVAMDNLLPGKSASIKVEIKNTLEDNVKDVSLILNLDNTSFTTIGGSEDSENEIRDDDSEFFEFGFKASSDIEPGDYNIPYTITYTDSEDNLKTKSGSFGISVSAETEISYSVDLRENIVGSKGDISFKVINSGLGEIRFVSIKITDAKGIEILSSPEEYIGSVDSDDFESSTFNVAFLDTDASITAKVIYKDFYNDEKIEFVTLPLKVYSKTRAVELGLLEKPNYIRNGLIMVGIVGFFVYRKFKKKNKR